MSESFCIIPTDSLEYSGRNPRQEIKNLKELAASIEEYGILEPIIVKPVADRFEIIVGERRVKAAIIAGLREVPAIVRNLTDQQADEIRLVENIHREDLTDAEKGDAIYSLLESYPERYANIRAISEAIGVSYGTVQSWCAKSRRLSPFVQEFVAHKQLTERAAQLLLKYDHETQDKLGRAIVEFDIRGGRDGVERRFIQLYDENPVADLRELADKAKEIQIAQVPLEQLSLNARAEIEKIIEDRKERAQQARRKARQRAKQKAMRKVPQPSEKPKISRETESILIMEDKSLTRENPEIPRKVIEEKAAEIIQRLGEIEHPLQRERMMREIPRAMEGLVKRVDSAPERRELMADKLNRLRELEDEGIFLSTLWDIGKRAKYAGARDFYGNCPPQIVEQCLLRLTKEGDLVVDPMAGSGTAIDVCDVLGRKCVAYDIKPPAWRNDITQNDSRKMPLTDKSADMVFLHPPYWDMVYYTRADEKLRDLSRAETLEGYLNMLREVLLECYRVLRDGKYLCLLLGDRVKKGEYVPLCRKAANMAEDVGFSDKGYAVKFTQGAKSLEKKGRIIYAEVAYTQNLKIEHDLVMFFQKHHTTHQR
ncbi:ParB/RepB/Spo0J family partition protein [Candidatus Bathyarchaeota archaeon]|nr:MAG: ParB/RepB/Spo0J family partition protein [Candidatus Bathyarchaeota archaeon]